MKLWKRAVLTVAVALLAAARWGAHAADAQVSPSLGRLPARGSDAVDPARGAGGTGVKGGYFGPVSLYVTFESMNLPPGVGIDMPDSVPTTVDGYTFTPGPNNASGLNDTHFGHDLDLWMFNATTVMASHDDVVMTKADSGSFDLVSFDFSGWPVNHEQPVTVTGQPGNVTITFVPDGLVDGSGGVPDFQTFSLPATFQGLTSVTFEQSGPGTTVGLFGLDNIVTNVPVPTVRSSWSRVKQLFR